MPFQTKSPILRNTLFWIAPLALLSGSSLSAQWSSPYGYQDDYHGEARRHQHDEKHAIKDHQREERYLYGNSWELRRHQHEERHQLKHHQRDERRYDDSDGYRRYDRNGGYEGGYSGQPY